MFGNIITNQKEINQTTKLITVLYTKVNEREYITNFIDRTEQVYKYIAVILNKLVLRTYFVLIKFLLLK